MQAGVEIPPGTNARIASDSTSEVSVSNRHQSSVEP
jgi:hypothetical protein